VVVDEAREALGGRVGDEALGGEPPDDGRVLHPVDVVGEQVTLDERSKVGVGLFGCGFCTEDLVDFDEAVLGVFPVGVLEALDDAIEHVGLVVGSVEGNDSVRLLADGLHREVVDEVLDLFVDVLRNFGDRFGVRDLAIFGDSEVRRKIS